MLHALAFASPDIAAAEFGPAILLGSIPYEENLLHCGSSAVSELAFIGLQGIATILTYTVQAVEGGVWLQVQSEEARFDMARKLTEVESSQRYSFLEALVGAMDAHLRFFQRSFEVITPSSPAMAKHRNCCLLHAAAKLFASRESQKKQSYNSKIHPI